MSIKIPNETKQFKQVANSDILGNIWSSFNLDLSENVGRIRVSGRGKLVTGSGTLANMETPVAFWYYRHSSDRIWCIAGSRVFYNTGDPDDTFIEDATASTPTDLNDGCDAALFNGGFYISGSGNLYKFLAGTWSTVSTAPNGGDASVCVFANRFYSSQSSSQIYSCDTTDTVVEPTSSPNTNLYTLNIGDFAGGLADDNKITCIRAASDRIWIATINTGGSTASMSGNRGRVFEWDGVSTRPSKVYELDSMGALSMVIKDDIPHITDANGKLLKFNGSSFEEVARLPISQSRYFNNPAGSTTQRFIHPKGMELRDDKICLLINNENSDASINENIPSGVWEYDENIGLYHRHSIGIADGTDFAQNRLSEVGALFWSKSASDTDNDGDLMCGARYFTSATVTAYGVFINNTKDTLKKVGYFVTTKIDSNSVTDSWQKIYVKHKRLLDASDRISIKYRTTEATAIEGTITWTSTTTFTSTLGLSSIAVGDEVEVTAGTGGGQIEHISAITENAGTYTVTLENAVTGATGTGKARFQKWIRAGTADITGQVEDIAEQAIAVISNWIQIKCVMYFTGKDEINELELVNQPDRLAE